MAAIFCDSLKKFKKLDTPVMKRYFNFFFFFSEFAI